MTLDLFNEGFVPLLVNEVANSLHFLKNISQYFKRSFQKKHSWYLWTIASVLFIFHFTHPPRPSGQLIEFGILEYCERESLTEISQKDK